MHVNTALVQWLSKKQCPKETLVFGSAFVTMKQGTDALRGSRYKLWNVGIPISGPSYLMGTIIHQDQNQS